MIVWTEIKTSLGFHGIDPTDWRLVPLVRVWWDEVCHKRGASRKARNTLMMLVAWEIWNERNARVFRNTAAPTTVVIAKIRDEASIWARAGAKYLCNIMLRE